jgi:hypothetical protein
MPSGTRTSEPVSTGMAVSRPNWVALRPSCFLIGMPMTPNIIQTMKQTVKARVLTISTDQALRSAVGADMHCSSGLLRSTVACAGAAAHSPERQALGGRSEDGPCGRPRPKELCAPGAARIGAACRLTALASSD